MKRKEPSCLDDRIKRLERQAREKSEYSGQIMCHVLPSIHKKFAIVAAKQGYTATGYTVALIETAVEEDEKNR